MARKRKKSIFSKLWLHKSRDWRRSLSSITNEFLRIKIACIVFWDFYDVEDKQCPVYLKKLVKEYDCYPVDFFHAMFEEQEIFNELRRIGYPPRLAKRRSFYEKINDKENS